MMKSFAVVEIEGGPVIKKSSGSCFDSRFCRSVVRRFAGQNFIVPFYSLVSKQLAFLFNDAQFILCFDNFGECFLKVLPKFPGRQMLL